jgi:hypothetical protein
LESPADTNKEEFVHQSSHKNAMRNTWEEIANESTVRNTGKESPTPRGETGGRKGLSVVVKWRKFARAWSP